MSGVYRIRGGTREYIGSTTRPFKDRWSEHLYDLRRGTHDNLHLQRLFNKYGEKSLIFEVVETCETNQTLEREQFYINQLEKSIRLNMSVVVNRPSHRMPHSKETRQKISNALLGRKRSIESIQKERETKAQNPYRHTEESRRRISQSKIGKLRSDVLKFWDEYRHRKLMIQNHD